MTRRAASFRFLVALLLTILAAAAPLAADLAGRWEGRLEIAGVTLDFDVDLTEADGAWTGDISIPEQGAVDLPLTAITVADGRVGFMIDGVPGDPTFAGDAAADGASIAGVFSQGGAEGGFTMYRGPDRAAAAGARLDELEPVIEQALADFMVPGLAIGVVVDDQVVWAKGFGLRDVGNAKPVTPKTLMAIGSSTKAFTTFLLATLVDEGLMEWDAPVAGYLPGFDLYDEYASAHLTPRDMVTHRSGLPRHDLAWYGNNDLPRDEMVRRLRYFQPNKELRQTFQYNNMMFLTAGYLGGVLAGSTWEDAVRARIFTPLGMTASNFSVDDSQKSDDFALPYQEKDDAIEEMAFRRIDAIGPAGSINSNVEDMIRWLRVHLGGGVVDGKRIVGAATLTELHTPQMTLARMPEHAEFAPGAYAMGWFVDAYRGFTRVEHGGNIDGFSALVTLYPRDGVGVVALANKNATGLPELVTRTIADRVFDLEPKDWLGEALERRKLGLEAADAAEEKKETRRVPGTEPAHALDAYAGEYAHPGYGVLTIARDGDALAMRFNGIETPLAHWHYEVFKGGENPDDRTFEDMEIKFATNFRGVVASVAAPFEPMADDIVFARRPEARLSDPAYLARFAGAYVLGGDEISFAVQGDRLILSVPGQPSFTLVPDITGEFGLEGVSGYSVRFDEKDGAVTAVLNQPNGVFELEKK